MKLLLLLCLVGVTVALAPGPALVGLVNTEPIHLASAPYAVSLQNANNALHLCGGVALQDSRFVLTSATCAYKLRPGLQQVRYGSSEYRYGGTTVPIVKVLIHPGFDSSRLLHNIALVEVKQNFSSANTVRFPCDHVLEEGELLHVAGWGSVSEESQGLMSLKLRQVALNYASSKCEPYYYDLGIDLFRNSNFCAGNLEYGGPALCHGDEGNGAIRSRYNTVHGVGSLVEFCGKARFLSVFTDVAPYAHWFKSMTGGVCAPGI